jgi:hypothetical protein
VVWDDLRDSLARPRQRVRVQCFVGAVYYVFGQNQLLVDFPQRDVEPGRDLRDRAPLFGARLPGGRRCSAFFQMVFWSRDVQGPAILLASL